MLTATFLLQGYIIDLRSASDAQSAKGKGGGPELITNYFGWKLVFADLTVLNWICAGIYMCGALTSPGCA